MGEDKILNPTVEIKQTDYLLILVRLKNINREIHEIIGEMSRMAIEGGEQQ